MIRKHVIAFTLAVALMQFSASVAAAAAPSLTLPPGIAAQAEPLLAAMMDQCSESHRSSEHMAMMMADMQALADRLPPGIFLQVLQTMAELPMEKMMVVHRAVREGGLLDQPPGQILRYVKDLAD